MPSAGLFLARLVEGRKEIAVTATQWWLSASELRLALVSPDAITEELILIASWNEASHTYDGSVWRAGRQRWVRCREA
ncbi:hypothetical protein CP97_00365 [Aurantiacibacter atlanticus]|uniref:Uncharacterized protein n=1 Tax=Aurantiacibacter atlanticus TaxID=1648404 RepID=A0A0H4VCM4_9SPHN|nr:hypothetical protein [Aurantiacibacter atlanticus]AKQ40834.2 hypothetical protein CP97_00365 [Aurantiacibacter atlanticus]